MDNYRLTLDIETSNKYEQAKKDIFKALHSVEKLGDNSLRYQLICEICRDKVFREISGLTEEQVELGLKYFGIIK